MLTPRMVPGLIRKKRAGYTNEGLAAMHGVSPALLRQAIAERIRAEKIADMERDRRKVIRELAKLGETEKDIAEAFGLEPRAVAIIIQPRGRRSGGKVRGENDRSG